MPCTPERGTATNSGEDVTTLSHKTLIFERNYLIHYIHYQSEHFIPCILHAAVLYWFWINDILWPMCDANDWISHSSMSQKLSTLHSDVLHYSAIFEYSHSYIQLPATCNDSELSRIKKKITGPDQHLYDMIHAEILFHNVANVGHKNPWHEMKM